MIRWTLVVIAYVVGFVMATGLWIVRVALISWGRGGVLCALRARYDLTFRCADGDMLLWLSLRGSLGVWASVRPWAQQLAHPMSQAIRQIGDQLNR